MKHNMNLTGAASVAAFPLGGIGTGNVSVGARGELRDWEIANGPGQGNSLPFTFFSIYAKAPSMARGVARVLESRLQPPYTGDVGLGNDSVTGLPRLRESVMHGEYPFVGIDFGDDKLPVTVSLEAFTPFVPLDADASGMPVAVLRYVVRNTSAESAMVTVAGSMSNPLGLTGYDQFHRPIFEGRPSIAWRDEGGLRGLHMTTDLPQDSLRYGTVSLCTSSPVTTAKPLWLAGFWNDGAQAFWDDFSSDGMLEAEDLFTLDTEAPSIVGDGEEPLLERLPRLRVGSIGIPKEIAAGDSATFEFILAWHVPNRPRGWGGHVIHNDPHIGDVIKNYYATIFNESWDVARKLNEDLVGLEGKSRQFHKAMYDSSLDVAVVDAMTANLATLRSTTCFRLEDGTFVAWEGSFDHTGSCEGTCTHVWNYAQAVAFLFPELERSARAVEFGLETDSSGRMQFRTNRVFGSPAWTMLPAVDGQLGTILRLYREWKFSGDDEFLIRLWPAAVAALNFAFTEWDSNGDYVLDAKQHTSYDIEFYGENSMGNSLFYAALRAGVEMAKHLGADYARWEQASIDGAQRMDDRLFNGEYYEQRVSDVNEHRYQFGAGVLSDQLFGQLLAHIVGLGYVLPREHVRSAIQSVFKYNYRRDLSDHESVQRTFALNDEAGLLLCTWPKGGRPTIPFIYSDEVWTGVEYQVAAHLIYEGFVDEGLTIVRGTRARYDGYKRNPWNEIECGNHYVRSLASWSLLLALSGVEYDAISKSLAFAPASDGSFRGFFSTGGGWGSVIISDKAVDVHVMHGRIALRSLTVRGVEVLGARAAGQEVILVEGDEFSVPMGS